MTLPCAFIHTRDDFPQGLVNRVHLYRQPTLHPLPNLTLYEHYRGSQSSLWICIFHNVKLHPQCVLSLLQERGSWFFIQVMVVLQEAPLLSPIVLHQEQLTQPIAHWCSHLIPIPQGPFWGDPSCLPPKYFPFLPNTLTRTSKSCCFIHLDF